MSKKISELDQATTLYDGCCFPIVQNGETKRVTYETFKEKIIDDIDPHLESKVDVKLVNKVDKIPGKGLSTNDFTDEYKEKLDEIPDTVFANGADYAEVASWNDGNPNKEDRLHRFVTLKASGRKIGIANSTDQIVGVISSHAAFIGNAKDYEPTDTTKAIVGIIGVVSVKTNDDTIQVNDRVMSDDNGYAVKSANNCGYRVLEVLSEGLLEIVISPNTDMIQRIKTDMVTVEAIAKGRATGYVFDTKADMENWLENEENVSKLNLGDNLYIRELEVPDYWWDGTQPQQLETQKVDLTAFAKTSDLPTKVSQLRNDSEYVTRSYIDSLNGNEVVY